MSYERALERAEENNPRARGRGWVFTINNFIEGDKDKVTGLIMSPRAKYGIAETEHTGEGEGTPHIQGYIYLQSETTRAWLERQLGGNAWIQKAKGSPEQNYKYCSKEGTVFVQRPMKKKEGKPSFLEMWEDMHKMTLEEIEEKYPREMYLRREKVMQVVIHAAMRNVKDYEGDLTAKNWWVWGKPGCGKSTWAKNNANNYTEIYKKNFNKWWDGFNVLSTKFVIMDDYPCAPKGDTLSYYMKIWCDRFPFSGECKGAHIMIEPRRFFLIITSNFSIDQCFENEEDREAIKRRFHECHMEKGDLMSMGDFTLDRSIIEQQ